MRTAIWLLTLLVSIAGNARADMSGADRADAAGRALIGTPAPALTLTTIDGDTIDIASLYGKRAVYLKFWATWCVPCRQQMPHFEHVFETAGEDLTVIAVNTGFNDSLESVRAYRAKLGIKMPIIIDDGRVATAFNLRVTPQHVVIGRDGRIAYVGHLADEKLDAALLVASTAPPAAVTPGAPPERSPGAALGKVLPVQELATIDGRRFALKDPKNARRTALVFLSPWCESYLKESRPSMSADCRRMREETETLAGDARMRWVGIASGLWATPEDLNAYRSEYHVNIPLALDDSGLLFRSFGVRQVPAVLIVDAHGKLERRIEAERVQARGALLAAIEARPDAR